MKQKNHHFGYSIAIKQSKIKVWNFLINVERWKEWDTELLDSKLFGEFREGAKGELKPKSGPKLTFHIHTLIPLSSYSFVVKMPVGQFIIKRMLTVQGQSVVFTDEIEFTGVLKHLFGLLLGTKFRKVLPEVMEQFKLIVEQE